MAAPVAARTVQHSFKARQQRAHRLVVRAVDAPVATDLQAELSSPAAVRKALLARGWDLAWIDGVTGEIQKRKLQATVPQIEAVIDFLQGLGIPLKSVENMASINKAILGQPVDALKAVADYAQRQGVTGAALAGLLEAHPNLLTYTVSADGKQLEKGQARASVDVSERHGAKVAGVSYWREGASFQTAPVAPLKPSAL
ncbi:hypothetical protein COHA_000912 [Chlorella ohadii]|uniref:Uncharacterized protein n=1 Tax=Chlorella ohadii TaxID=2649997 RepID=A0AAD5E033_9CHLO|nr:hypothetical protein COHA_000912 [Chlorella ohadii]